MKTPPVRAWLLPGILAMCPFIAPGQQEILYREDFNTDGDGTRYTTEGAFVSEFEDHGANGISGDQEGPVYWGHSSSVSFVGVAAQPPARRAVISWHHELTAEDVTEDGLALLDATIAWLTDSQANLRVLFSPAPGGPGDDIIVERLTAAGATVTGDDIEGGDPPAASNFDLVIHSSQGQQPSRFTRYPVPYLTYNAPDHDDELVTTIGISEARTLADVSIKAPEHPAAGGLSGEVMPFNGEVTLDFPGTGVPEDSITVATYPIVDVPPVNSLADVQAMVDGNVETVVDEGTIGIADIEGGDGGNFTGDEQAPGNPVGSFATVGTGEITVKTPGTYGFGMWVSGGGRLRLDVDGNGLDAADTVIEQDNVTFVDGVIDPTSDYADVTFASAGNVAFEWVAYSPTDAFGSELFFSIAEGADQRDELDNQEVWAPLSDWEAQGIDSLPLNLDGEIAVTKYEQPAQVIEERPLIVLINGPEEGGKVFGGGAFLGFEGDGFFAGAALNKFSAEVDPKTLTLNPIDVTGETGLRLEVLLAATRLDFETSDRLDILIDPNNSGNFTELTHFTAPSGNDKFFDNGTTDLDIAFKKVVLPIPDGATNLVIKIEAVTTWWNEIVGIDDLRIVKDTPIEFTELWLLGDDTNGNQAEFSQEQGMDEAPGSATAQDDDFYFWGVYPDPIGTVLNNEPFTNYDRAHVPGDPFNRIHFNLDAASAAADTQLRLTFGLCCFGAVDQGPSDHDMVFRLNGKEFFSENGVNSDRVVQETVTAGDFDVVAGANTIEIERTGGSPSAWVQYDYVRLEASAGAPFPQPTDGGGGDGELPEWALGPEGTAGEAGLAGYYWRLEPKAVPTSGEPLHRTGDGPGGAAGENSGWADDNVFNTPTRGSFSATTFNYGGNDLTPIEEWLMADAGSYSGGGGDLEANLDDGVFRMVGYIQVDAPGQRTFSTTSDDGSVVYIGPDLVISNDNGHGNQTVENTYDFPAAGYYPIDVRYFNGDWLNEAGTEHGGANFIGEAGFENFVQSIDGMVPWEAVSPEPPSIDGLLGYWRFNEGSGATVADSSGNGNDGTIIAPGAAWVEDPALGSVYQSGGGSYVDFGTILPVIGVDTDFTWSFWVNADETDNNNIVFGNRWSPDGTDFAPREFIKFTPRVFEWHFNGGGENVPGDNSMFVVGEWAHNLVVKSGSTLTYYRNGAEIATSEITGAPANAQPLYLGGQNGAENFSGKFDEVAVFNRALSVDEVAEVYARGQNGESLGSGSGPGPDDLPPITNVGLDGDGNVSFNVPDGVTADIQYSVDLLEWETIANGITGPYNDTDATRRARPAGYYRAAQ